MKLRIDEKIFAMSKFVFYVGCLNTVFATMVFANEGYSQNLEETYVNVKWQKMPLDKAFQDLQEQTDFYFTYNHEAISYISITNRNKNVSLANLLKFIASETDLFFRVQDEIIYVATDRFGGSKKNVKMYREVQIMVPELTGQVLLGLDDKKIIHEVTLSQNASKKKLKGTVRNERGDQLVGASILIKETGLGTITDLAGIFTIAIAEGGGTTLEVSYVGYETREIVLDGRERLEIILEESIEKLDEIVVIGYGEQSQTKVTGAISKAGSARLEKFASGSVDEQLIGYLSGVQINTVNGQPGSDAQIQIRGINTLTAGASPLIVVDGVPLSEGSSLNTINPNNIASIDILKDAASAAIYGSRASSGVILITTKSGREGKMKVTLDVYGGYQQRADQVEFADAYSAAQFFTEARDWGYVSKDPVKRSSSDSEETRIANGANKRELRLDYLEPYLEGRPGLVNTDWLDIIYRDAPIYNADLSFSGGNKSGNYFVSANYFNQDGIARGTDFERFSGIIKVNGTLSDRLRFGLSLNPSYSKQDHTDLGNWRADPIAASMTYYPFFEPFNEDGSIALSQGQILNTPADGSLQENPLAYVDIKDDRNVFRTFGNIFLTFEPVRGVRLKTVLGGDYQHFFYDFFKASTLGEYRSIAPNPAKASETNGRILNYVSENTLSYSRIFDLHEIDLIGGYTYQREEGSRSEITGTNIQDDLLDNVAGASDHTLSAFRYTDVLISYLGRVQYFFNDKYQVSVALRRDGSSRFGDNLKWGTFPSVAVGWILSDEDFFPQSTVLPYLKIRASWGETGNNQIGFYSSKALLSPSNYVFGDELSAGFRSTTSPNNGLSWETTASLNVGLDFKLWKKLTISTNYYNSRTKDLLLNVPVPQQSGFTTSLQNIGEVENRGFEMELNAPGIDLGPVKWTFAANLTTNQNEVLSLPEAQEEIRWGSNGAWRTEVGGPVANITAYNIIGVYKTQEEIEGTPHLTGTLTGDYIVEDTNGDGVINDDDKIGMGTFAPELTYGFSSSFTYKNFDLSFAINGVDGRSAYFYDEAVITGVGEGFGAPSKYYMENRYHPVNNPDGFLGRPNLGNFSAARRNTRVSSLYIQNADYVRMRFLQIGYSLPRPLVGKIGMTGLRVYASANNLFIITKYRGYNPDSSEFRIDTDILRSGYAQDNYPVTRSFIFGFNASF